MHIVSLVSQVSKNSSIAKVFVEDAGTNFCASSPIIGLTSCQFQVKLYLSCPIVNNLCVAVCKLLLLYTYFPGNHEPQPDVPQAVLPRRRR